ncbi:MAG: hypothetical protein KKC37_02630, partial [Proteobacteria bacterium]|nr:hypothetical protein [Pseudomonadota bacterium]
MSDVMRDDKPGPDRTGKPEDSVEETGRASGRSEVLGALIVGDAFAVPMVEELERGNYNTGALNLIFSSGV